VAVAGGAVQRFELAVLELDQGAVAVRAEDDFDLGLEIGKSGTVTDYEPSPLKSEREIGYCPGFQTNAWLTHFVELLEAWPAE
jgi:hypothetical protein